jgi:type IV pilus assembly protein PilX
MRMQTPIRRQRGAALVVGLMLLLVLTLLAVSGMNTASTELIMAGNEQFQENALQAAETGIEQAMRNGAFNPSNATENVATTAVAGTTTDFYTTSITPQPGVNMPQQAMWGNRWDSFSTFHFQIQSQGTSARNAQTTHVQGMFVIAPFDPGTPAPLTGVPTALTP